MTFQELAKCLKKHGYFSKKFEKEIAGHGLRGAAYEMHKADRQYLSDNLDPSSEGNYLADFLAKEGEKPAQPYIKFFKGCAHAAGPGLVVFQPDWTKIRRRIEDCLRKGPDYKIEEIATRLHVSLF